MFNNIQIEVKEFEKKKQKRDNPEVLNYSKEWENFFEEIRDKKGIKNQVSFFDIIIKGDFNNES